MYLWDIKYIKCGMKELRQTQDSIRWTSKKLKPVHIVNREKQMYMLLCFVIEPKTSGEKCHYFYQDLVIEISG